MANSKATEGIKEILNILEDEEIIQLAATTTQNLIKKEVIKSKDEAADIILRHSPDLSTILNRKVIRREYLFQYLDKRGITVTTPATKLALINKILKLWSDDSGKDPNNAVSNKTIIEQSVTTMPSPVNDVNSLATKFSEWFYSILNENEPIGEEHFWNDCSLKLNLLSDGANSTNSVENDCTEVVNLLFNTKREHDLYFNPNLSNEGVKGKMDNHGLVIVFTCGTLHTKSACVGVFEQMFALARDPYAENNWKIKHTQLSLRSKAAVTDMPRLEESTLNAPLPLCNS